MIDPQSAVPVDAGTHSYERGHGRPPCRAVADPETVGEPTLMLAVTDNAATAIRDITSQQEVPAGAGLRIAADTFEGSLTLSLVAEPYEGDQVVDTAGARVFLDALAAEMLDD